MSEQQTEQKTYQKTKDTIQLINAGLPIKQALQVTNFKKDIAPETVSRWKKKYQKYSLTAPKITKLAHNAIVDCLTDQPIIQVKKDKDGNEINEAISPTWSNKMAAASMVYDRAEPVIHKAESVSHHVIHPVDLSRYRNDAIIDGGSNTEVIDISGS